jgi:UDP-glucose:glycoprotein glucosyltransferase
LHKGVSAAGSSVLPRVIHAVQSTQPSNVASVTIGRILLQALNGTTSADDLIASIKKEKRRQAVSRYYSSNSIEYEQHSATIQEFLQRVLKMDSPMSCVVVNGKVFDLSVGDRMPGITEFSSLAAAELSKHATGQIWSILTQLSSGIHTSIGERDDFFAAISAYVYASIARAKASGSDSQRLSMQTLSEISKCDSGCIQITSSLSSRMPQSASQHIFAAVNPLSHQGQLIAPILQTIEESIMASIVVILNPQSKLSELPVKRFFKVAFPGSLKFDASGALQPNHVISFNNLPAGPLLTLTLHTPANWMARPVRSAHDLDNIHLESTDYPVSAFFELKKLTIEGSCLDKRQHRPAAGVQLLLGTDSNPAIYDTIVMSNLGYFQLKANPGAWRLQLRPGRSTTVYSIVSHDGTEPSLNSRPPTVIVNRFTSKQLTIAVSPNPGQERTRLLDIPDVPEESSDSNTAQNMPSVDALEQNVDSGWWSAVTSLFKSAPSNSAVAPLDALNVKRHGETIHVFSLASGHLYERFLKIMMLSVLKHTSHPVKFWFLENCMSPRLKQFLPYFAKAYGFEYSLVQYNWPPWLNKQTEKHRVIWAYKILFLDVLFPLDVKKIIFVDADQVVRADLNELMELDLEGAPYGEFEHNSFAARFLTSFYQVMAVC